MPEAVLSEGKCFIGMPNNFTTEREQIFPFNIDRWMLSLHDGNRKNNIQNSIFTSNISDRVALIKLRPLDRTLDSKWSLIDSDHCERDIILWAYYIGAMSLCHIWNGF